jgi:purine-cytosine permease-like protein
MELALDITVVVAIIGALTVVTNIIVEVLKRATWEKMPTNLLAVIVAMVLTLVAFFGYMAYLGIAVMWYYVAAAVVVGFAVAYAAMFGFDKLKEAIQQMKKNTM